VESIKKWLLLVLLCTIPVCYGLTVQDVQKLDKNKFFGVWSKFLDQVVEAKQNPISNENEAVYKAFLQQGETLNLPKVTGNKNSISGMKKQMALIKERISKQKVFFDEWNMFHESMGSIQQYPIPSQIEEKYTTLVRQAKDLGIKNSFVQEMQKKMKDIKEKLKLMFVSAAEPVQEPVVETPQAEEMAEEAVEEESQGQEDISEGSLLHNI
jgi:hypothetical protein